MKKGYRYDQLSEKKCRKCGRRLKLRLVITQDANICYRCVKEVMIKRSIGMSRAKRVFA